MNDTTVWVVFDCSDNRMLGIFDDMRFARQSAEEYCDDNDVELNLDVICYSIPLNENVNAQLGTEQEGVTML